MDTVRNAYDIVIRRRCTSCAHKDLTRAKTVRRCTLRHVAVDAGYCCQLWRLSEQLRQAGLGLGRVKRLDYLKYVLDIRSEEAKNEELGIAFEHKSIEQIRKDFEEKNGSIFLSL
jgi:hypothetical protein